jgi:predicted nucleotide-binding protein (sugar kinase/HSP70/actin superfamily)
MVIAIDNLSIAVTLASRAYHHAVEMKKGLPQRIANERTVGIVRRNSLATRMRLTMATSTIIFSMGTSSTRAPI